jgi:phosphoribosylglycinamide synthetase-like protein
MKIFFISKEADSAGLWGMCQKEGTQVTAWIKEPWARRVYDGITNKVEALEQGLKEKPDFIVIDLNGLGKLGDDLRKDGYKVIGGGELAERLEMERAWAGKVAEQYGIKVPSTQRFEDLGSAISFVKKTKEPLAIKWDANAGGESASYVAKDQEDMLDYLTQQKESGKINGNKFILQEVVRGAEISTELWFSAGNPVWPANSTLEDKHFLAGGLGPRTGCEVSLVYHYAGTASSLVDKTIRKLFPLLKYSRYTGPLDVNCIVSEEDHEPYFLEFSPRIGYSAIYAYMAILGLPISEYFARIAGISHAPRGSVLTPFKALWGSALKISIPPYPTHIEPDEAAKETYGLQEGVKINGHYGPDFIPIDVQKGKRTDLECSGVTGIIGEAIGRGNSILETWRASQKVFKSVECPNQQGRYVDGISDIWARARKLKSWGYDIPISGETPVRATPSHSSPV